jgi:hypothetical protein
MTWLEVEIGLACRMAFGSTSTGLPAMASFGAVPLTRKIVGLFVGLSQNRAEIHK